eukprot:Sdes_comp19773_c0_seq1m11828
MSNSSSSSANSLSDSHRNKIQNFGSLLGEEKYRQQEFAQIVGNLLYSETPSKELAKEFSTPPSEQSFVFVDETQNICGRKSLKRGKISDYQKLGFILEEASPSSPFPPAISPNKPLKAVNPAKCEPHFTTAAKNDNDQRESTSVVVTGESQADEHFSKSLNLFYQRRRSSAAPQNHADSFYHSSPSVLPFISADQNCSPASGLSLDPPNPTLDPQLPSCLDSSLSGASLVDFPSLRRSSQGSNRRASLEFTLPYKSGSLKIKRSESQPNSPYFIGEKNFVSSSPSPSRKTASFHKETHFLTSNTLSQLNEFCAPENDESFCSRKFLHRDRRGSSGYSVSSVETQKVASCEEDCFVENLPMSVYPPSQHQPAASFLQSFSESYPEAFLNSEVAGMVGDSFFEVLQLEESQSTQNISYTPSLSLLSPPYSSSETDSDLSSSLSMVLASSSSSSCTSTSSTTSTPSSSSQTLHTAHASNDSSQPHAIPSSCQSYSLSQPQNFPKPRSSPLPPTYASTAAPSTHYSSPVFSINSSDLDSSPSSFTNPSTQTIPP